MKDSYIYHAGLNYFFVFILKRKKLCLYEHLTYFEDIRFVFH